MSSRQPDLLKEQMPGPRIAILAESLFLANLMIAPGVAFVALLALWWFKRDTADEISRNHLHQTVVASIRGGLILVGISVAIFLLGGFGNPWAWVLGVLYFICLHATLIIGGVVGLNRAFLAQKWHFPVIGSRRDG